MYWTIDVNPILLLAFVGMLAYLINRYMTELYSVTEKLGIPGPKPIWVIGNVLSFRSKDILDVFACWKKKYGGIYGFYEGLQPGIVINDPELAQMVLNKQFQNFSVRTVCRPFIYTLDNLRIVCLDGEQWKHQRAVLNKVLGCSETLKQVVQTVERATVTLHHTIEQQRRLFSDNLNITDTVNRFTSELVIRILLNMTEADIEKYRDDIYQYQVLSSRSASVENQAAGLARIFPMLTPILKLADKDHRKAHDKVMSIVIKFLKSQNNSLMDFKHDSLSSYLRTLTVFHRDIDGSLSNRKMSSDEMVAHLMSLLSEMYQSTSSAVQYMIYELARNSICQERLYDEIFQACPEVDNSICKLQNLKYFDMFFNETYRHHPIAPGLSRICTQDCKLRGYSIKAGMTVRIMTSTMYKDDAIFPEADKFLPERFSREQREKCHQYSFLPFGHGPRACPGSKIAMILIKVMMISIMKKYRFSINDQTEVPLKEALRPSLTPANDVHVTLTERCLTV